MVRKVLRSEATEFRYERDEQPLPRIGPWQKVLEQLLAGNEAKVRREQLTLIRIFEDLQIPTQVGHLFQFDSGHRSDLKPATIPI